MKRTLIILLALSLFLSGCARQNEWTIYVVEDVSGAYVSKYHYEVNFLPQMIKPVTFTSND